MERQRVQPAPGMLVRYETPSRGHIPPQGAAVPMTSYYRRRVRDGDLVIVNPAKAAKAATPEG